MRHNQSHRMKPHGALPQSTFGIGYKGDHGIRRPLLDTPARFPHKSSLVSQGAILRRIVKGSYLKHEASRQPKSSTKGTKRSIKLLFDNAPLISSKGATDDNFQNMEDYFHCPLDLDPFHLQRFPLSQLYVGVQLLAETHNVLGTFRNERSVYGFFRGFLFK